MNPYACAIALRPRNPLEVLDLTLRFLATSPGPFLRLSALVLVPSAVMVLALGAWLEHHAWGVALIWLAGPVLRSPYTVLGAERLFHGSPSARLALRRTASQSGRLFLIAASSATVLLVSATTLFVSWVPMQAVALYLPETLLLEKDRLRRTGMRSLTLATRHLAATMVGALAAFVLGVWVVLATEALAQGLLDSTFQLGQPFGALANGDVTPWLVVGSLLAQPVVAVYRLMLYVDARLRNEGWDLQVRFLGLAEGA